MISTTIPITIPQTIMRGTGIAYVHVHVYTSRLVMKDMGGFLQVLGTVWGRLCSIPMRVSMPVLGNGGFDNDFKSMCASVRKCVVPCPESVQNYARDQWFAAIVTENNCNLLSPMRGNKVSSRHVDGLLGDEMVRMGMIDSTCDFWIIPLPPMTNEHNKSMVTLEKIVENLMVTYTGDHKKVSFLDVARLPSQPLDIHRMVVRESGAMMEMRDGFRRLWNRSFDLHSCYHVFGDSVVGRLY